MNVNSSRPHLNEGKCISFKYRGRDTDRKTDTPQTERNPKPSAVTKKAEELSCNNQASQWRWNVQLTTFGRWTKELAQAKTSAIPTQTS